MADVLSEWKEIMGNQDCILYLVPLAIAAHCKQLNRSNLSLIVEAGSWSIESLPTEYIFQVGKKSRGVFDQLERQRTRTEALGNFSCRR